MFLLYSVLFTLGAILASPYHVWRRGGIRSLAGWRERLGLLPQSFRESDAGSIWVHAVSVGETLAVVGLVRELQQNFPDRKIYISHVTPAGREAGEARLPGLAGRFYLPLDWRWSVGRVLRQLRPGLLLIVETELWPNLLRAARETGTRVVLVNARISDRSFPGYRLIRGFMRRVLENVDQICAQTDRDAEHFRLLGARPDQVSVTGNLKFDALPVHLEAARQLKLALGATRRRPVIVAASTMAGEEQLLLKPWKDIRERYPRALLILAPRHPARFEAVAQLLTSHGMSFVRRTGLQGIEGTRRDAPTLDLPEILLLDTIGELAGIFELANLVFVGGSLVPTGGHNLLEPAFWGKAILFGPHMENFADIARLFVESGAAVQVRDARELTRRTLELLENEQRRHELGDKAMRVLKAESGAAQRVLHYLKESLGEAGSVHPRS